MVPSTSPNLSGKWETHVVASAEMAVSSQADWVTASRGFVRTGRQISPLPDLLLVLDGPGKLAW